MPRVTAGFSLPWGASRPRAAAVSAPMAAATVAHVGVRAPWGRSIAAAARPVSAPWRVLAEAQAQSVARWGALAVSSRMGAWSRLPWGALSAIDRARLARWQSFGVAVQPSAAAPWVVSKASDARRRGVWGGPMPRMDRAIAGVVVPGIATDWRYILPWLLYSRPMQPGWGVVSNPPGSGDPDNPALFAILPARYYMTVHDVRAVLLPAGTPLDLFDLSIAADAGSYAWSLSANGAAGLFDLLAPASGAQPASVRVTVDGIEWVFSVDGLQRTEAFGKRGTRITGRSVTSLLAAPYARETSRLSAVPANAQQLAQAALEFTGVALDWGLDDWLVPAGAWSHTGTPLAAVQAIAEAVGGYVLSHRSQPTLLVRHPYPSLAGGGIPGGPWNWGGAAGPVAPDVSLAPSAIITTSIERRDGPDINAVYVSGTSAGVLALVKRAGSDGAKLGSLVTHPLITAQAAASQRGLAVLGAAGPKHYAQLSLPVLTGPDEPGVLDVGQLVQVEDASPWRGRVRSVSLQAGSGKVRQSVTIERHLGA